MGFFQDDNGNKSMTRLIFFIGFVSAIIMTAFIVFQGEHLAAAAFFAAMIIPLTGLKVGQKSQEVRMKGAKDEDDEPDGPDLKNGKIN